MPSRMFLTKQLLAAVIGCASAGCTVVQDPAEIADTALPLDTTEAPDVAPEDVAVVDEIIDDITPDIPTEPEDVPVGPTDVFIHVDTTADVPTTDATPTDTTGDAGPTLPPWDTPRMPRWRLAWQDDFNGPPCDPNDTASCETTEDRDRALACFGSRTAPVPTRIVRTFHVNPDDATHSDTRNISALANLDKCVWSVAEHVNSRHYIGPAGPIMAYSPDAVRVERGELRITTRRVGSNTDCGRKLYAAGPSSEENMSRSCEYQGGTLMTQPFHGLDNAGDADGYASGNGRIFPPSGANGGRLEVRVMSPRLRGNMSVVSTWPTSGAAASPEYMVYQHRIDQPRTSRQAATVYGAGTSASATATHSWDETQPEALHDEFHVFGVNWVADDYVSFDMNQRSLGTIASGANIGAGGQCLALPATANPVHLAIRDLIAQYESAPGSGPEGGSQSPDTLRIDWVRWWELCDNDGDPACVESTINAACPNPCDGLGTYENGLCFVGNTPEETTGAVSDHYIGYLPGTGIMPCTRGGIRLEGICALVALPAGRIGTIEGDRMYVGPTCEPTAALVNCGEPCPVEGTTWVADRSACFYRAGVDGTNSFVYDNGLYYGRIDGNPAGPCPFGGNFDGANCRVGSSPAGHYALTFGNDYYLRPFACPDGGTWDQDKKACLVKSFPAGTNPFVYAGGIYYPSATAGTCAHGGTWDGANCRLRDVPVGARAFSDGNNAYFRAECSPSTNWSALQTYPGSNALTGSPCP